MTFCTIFLKALISRDPEKNVHDDKYIANIEKIILQHCVYIASDGGRVCRPLVIADNGKSRIKEHHIKELVVSIVYAFCLTAVLVGCKLTEHFSFQGWSPHFW